MPYDEEGNWISWQDESRPATPMDIYGRPARQLESSDQARVPVYQRSPEELSEDRETLIRRISPVMSLLHWFDKQRNTAASGAYGAFRGSGEEQSEDENAVPTNLLSGLRRGFKQSGPDISWGDVVGLGPGTPEMGWPEWTGRNAARLAMDIVGDPLTYEFAPASGATKLGKLMKASFPWLKEGQTLAGAGSQALHLPQIAENVTYKTPGLRELPRIFRHTSTPEMDAIIRRQRYGGNEALQEAEKLAEEGQAAARAAGITPEQDLALFHATERPDAILPDIPQEARQSVDPLLRFRDRGFKEMNERRVAAGMEPVPNISSRDYTQVPHYYFGRGPVTSEKGMLAKIRDWNTTDRWPSRRLKAWIDPETGQPPEKLRDFISAENPEYLGQAGIYKGEEGYRYGGRPIEPSPEVSLAETLAARNLNLDPNSVNKNVFDALSRQTREQQKQINFLKTRGEAIDQGQIRKIQSQAEEPGGAWNWLKSLTEEPKPEPFNIKGLEGYEAHPAIVDRMMTLAGQSVDPSAMTSLEQILRALNETRIGEANKNFTNMWKSTVLGLHPGYYFGNLTSNLQQNYLKGTDAKDILPRHYQAYEIHQGRGEDLLPGFDLKRESELRDVIGSGFFGGQKADVTQSEGAGLIHRLSQYPPFKQIGAAQDFVTEKVGRPLEDISKNALFLDYVMKNKPDDLALLSKEAQARFFDDAAAHAHLGMIDYGPGGGWTGTEKQLLPWVPFYKWTRGLAESTADAALHRPQRLARFDRLLNTMTEPVTPDDKRAMADWMKGQAPVQGGLGHTFEPDEEGNRRVFLANRFLAQGNLQQMADHPLTFLTSMATPGAKTPAELIANYSGFFGRDIDPIVGFPGNVINPLTGSDNYSGANRQLFGQTPPASLDYLASQMPGGRYLNEVNELGRALGIEDKLRKSPPSFPEWLLWWITGGKTFAFDRDRAMGARERDEDRKLSAIRFKLKRSGERGDESEVSRYKKLLEQAEENKNMVLYGR